MFVVYDVPELEEFLLSVARECHPDTPLLCTDPLLFGDETIRVATDVLSELMWDMENALNELPVSLILPGQRTIDRIRYYPEFNKAYALGILDGMSVCLEV